MTGTRNQTIRFRFLSTFDDLSFTITTLIAFLNDLKMNTVRCFVVKFIIILLALIQGLECGK